MCSTIDAPLLSAPVLAAVAEEAERLRLATRAQRTAARELADELERCPETRAPRLLLGRDPHQTWCLAEELIERSRGAIFDSDPCRAVRLARLAVTAAGCLDTRLYGNALAADLRARAWGHLGNAHRCASRLRAAETALGEAEDLLLEGTGDPLEEAHLLSLRASLATSLGDYEGALALLDPALELYLELGERRLAAQVLVQKCGAAGYLDPAEGAELARRAEELLRDSPECRLVSMARHNRVVWLVESGRAEEARELLEASRQLFRRFDGSWTRVHLTWTEARLDLALGEVEEAEARLETLLGELLERDHRLDAALCALDLAACRLAAGRAREAAELAGAMAEHLRAWGAHPRAREAWALLHQSLCLEKATEGLIQELGAYLRRAWKNPRLAFRPGSGES